MKRIAALTLAGLMVSGPSVAQEQSLAGQISIELNAVDPGPSACTLSFVVINGFDTEVTSAVYETVLFDAAGQVERLTLFDFGALPPGRPRVRQFAIPDISCDDLGQILFNGASACEGADLPAAACDTGLTVSSRTDVAMTG